MNEKIQKVLNFYLFTNVLKERIRSGVKVWHINKKRLESVAEHVYGVCMLAIAIDSEYDFNINIEKVIMLLVTHELEECYLGDLTPFDNISKDEKQLKGEEAVRIVLDGLIKKEDYLKLTKEYDAKITLEAKFANYCDKLEMMLQMKIYEDFGYSNLYDEKNANLVLQPWIKKLINGGSKTIADLFFDYHINAFEGDKTFEEIAKYAQENKFKKFDVEE